MTVSSQKIKRSSSTADLAMGAPYSRLVAGHQGLAQALGEILGIPAERILPTAGATGAIEAGRNHVLMTCGRGPSVLMVSPDYWRARESFIGLGFKPIEIDIAARGFAIDESEIAADIESHSPDLVYMSLPHNPSGAVFDAAALLGSVSHDRTVLIDMTLPWHGSDPLASLATLYREFEGRRNLFLAGSTSKSHGTAVHRVGWLVSTSAADAKKLSLANRNVISVEAARNGIARLGEKPSVDEALASSFAVLTEGEQSGCYEIVRPPRRAKSCYVLIRVDKQRAEIEQALVREGIAVMLGSRIGLAPEYIRLEMSEPASVAAFVDVVRSV